MKGETLSKKEKGFVKDWIKTGNGTQSILNNYNTKSENVAGVMAVENLAKPKIQKAIMSIAEQIPDEDLVKVHKEGLNAGKTIFKNNNSTGEVEEVGYEPDYAVRHKYLDSAYKIKGIYSQDENSKINIVVPVLVKFLDKKDDTANNNGDTNRIPETV